MWWAGIIGIISLIVGMFGIANIMFVTVKERTSVIGLKKAIGAKKSSILFEFLAGGSHPLFDGRRFWVVLCFYIICSADKT
jgi:putative ABC transport system permease protein